ncbi:uncharacterized protein LOC141721845 [Apium graveolens]|uniref:uncharacterized protein LOC141721845 n=1 Tax=Apium graveolens TaxID=4045 RepID=UPI003D7B8880
MDSEMIQAQLAGCGRVRLCYDVVEWQHPDRVNRQFGASPQIPRAPVNMVGYRRAKEATFTGEDWLVRWFIDIGKWARFCSNLDRRVDDSVDIASEADYMVWYADISRMRIGKPDPQPQQQYKTREFYDSLEGYEVMVVGLNMLKQLDARVPPEFVEEFGRISCTFFTQFSRLMKNVKGPAYRPPTFQNIKPDFIAPSADDFDIPAISVQDVVDMTQPSQHVSQPPQTIASSSRLVKLASRRVKEEKWSITKSLSMTKKNAIYSDWGWGFGIAPRILGGLTVQDYHVHASAMQSLLQEHGLMTGSYTLIWDC